MRKTYTQLRRAACEASAMPSWEGHSEEFPNSRKDPSHAESQASQDRLGVHSPCSLTPPPNRACGGLAARITGTHQRPVTWILPPPPALPFILRLGVDEQATPGSHAHLSHCQEPAVYPKQTETLIQPTQLTLAWLEPCTQRPLEFILNPHCLLQSSLY